MTDDFDRLREAASTAQNMLMRVGGSQGGLAAQIERGDWNNDLTQQQMTDLAELLYAMSENVRYTRVLADRLRSYPARSTPTAGHLERVVAQGLPLNRKERFYTGTVLPMIVAGDGFAHLHRFLALCGLQIEPLDDRALDGGASIEFFTEYNFSESRFTDDDRARFPDLPNADTPDVVIVGPDWLVAVEAKMFHDPPSRALNEQMRRQRVMVDYWRERLEIPADRVAHVLLLPSELPTRGVVGKVVTWESVLDEYQTFGPRYWISMLQTAIGRYDELRSRGAASGINADSHMIGAEIVEAHALGELDYAYMGRKLGLDGKLLADDLRTGNWRSRLYEVRHGPLPGNGNWFTIAEFIASTAL